MCNEEFEKHGCTRVSVRFPSSSPGTTFRALNGFQAARLRMPPGVCGIPSASEDAALPGFGSGGLADMEGRTACLPEGRCDPLRSFEVGTEAAPASMITARLECAADHRNPLVDDDGEEPAAAGPEFLGVEDRPQAQLGIQRPIHSLQVREHPVGVPQGVVISIGEVGAQDMSSLPTSLRHRPSSE